MLFSNKTRNLCYLFLIVIFALLVRLAYWLEYPLQPKDAILFLNIASDWQNYGLKEALVWFPRIGPLYPWLMIKLAGISGISLPQAGFLISIFSGSFLTVPAYFIARKTIKNNYFAFLAAIFVAVHPLFLRTSIEILRDSLCLFIAACGLAIFIYSQEKPEKKITYLSIAFSGSLFGLASMVRDECFEFLLALGLWLVIEIFFFIKKQHQKAIKYTIMFLLVAIGYFAVTIPVEISIKKHGAQWRPIPVRIQQHIEVLLNGKGDIL